MNMKKKTLSVLIILAVILSLLSTTAFAAFSSQDFSKYSDAELKQLYEDVREEMISRSLPLAQEMTLREGKFIVGEDLLPGTYTLKCIQTAGDTYSDMYSSLGDAYSALDSSLGDLMGSLGGMMSTVSYAEVEILGDYGAVLKSFEMKAGDSVRISLTENTALQITEGTCALTAD